ncbi:hypothetical protein [Cellulomonas iranensis]|uniref:hypothetical protein n=1 Tax=Cellulomonas iranensis TaxID=76862 RepID=UPI0013D2C534|nr:hypothetical protein [Cellulomonas iranensis]
MSRRLAWATVATGLAAAALLVVQLVRPDLQMTGAVLVPWLILATVAVILAAAAPPSGGAR